MAAEEEILLECPLCGRETAHAVGYAGRVVLVVRCTVCGTETRNPSRDPVRDYLGDLGSRLVTKPARLAARLRRNPVGTVGHTAAALGRQPSKLSREIRAVRAAARSRGER